MADYALTCSCGHRTSRPTLGQAEAALLRHVEKNDVAGHAVKIQRQLPTGTSR
jgi:hypothetical protein